jgi:hypothetical protein
LHVSAEDAGVGEGEFAEGIMDMGVNSGIVEDEVGFDLAEEVGEIGGEGL